MTTYNVRRVPLQPDNIPAELRSLPNWVAWREKPDAKGGKPGKIPVNPRTGDEAKSNDRTTWGSFDDALVRMQSDSLPGIGFVFSAESQYVGTDLDKCRDPETGKIDPWAAEIVRVLDTYAEASVTGTGVHCIARGTLPDQGRKRGNVEMYCSGRFFCFTGALLPDTAAEIRERTVPLAVIHAQWIAKPASQAKPPPPRAAAPRTATLLRRAERYVAKTQPVSEGGRNDAAFHLAGHLAALVDTNGECLGKDEILALLSNWNSRCSPPLSDSELQACVHSGMNNGTPRAPKPAAAPLPSTATAPRPRALNGILTPGAHTLPTGEYREIQGTEFARQVLCKLPEGTIYRRGGAIGEVFGHPTEFRVLTPHRVRILTGKHVRLCSSKAGKDDEPPTETFQPVSRDHADLILASASDHGDVRDLDHIVSHPVFAADWTLSRPGHSKRTYYDEPAALAHLEPIRDRHEIQAVFDDLLVDFPFEAESDRQTYIGLLLTPLVRPAIQGNCPLHLITSPQERTGKTKLASDVLGGVYLGAPVPVMQLSGSEDEREKRILAMLLAGTRLIHLDNLAGELDSAVLASTLTASHVHGRILGRTENVTVPNGCVVVATGNNARTSSEIAKRTVPIRLLAREQAPETRVDFRHQDIAAYVVEQRRAVLGAMVGMVLNWLDAGQPAAKRPMGGFDAWAAVVGGILTTAGYSDWLSSAAEWREGADDFSADLAQFVDLWSATYGLNTPAELLTLADANGLFGPMLMRVPGERARVTAFSIRVLKRAAGRVVGPWRIVTSSSGNNRSYHLRPL